MSSELKPLEKKVPQEVPIKTEEHFTEIGIQKSIAQKILSFLKKCKDNNIKEADVIFIDFYERLFKLEEKRQAIFVLLLNEINPKTFANINKLLWLIDTLSFFKLSLVKDIKDNDSGILFLIAEYNYTLDDKKADLLIKRDTMYKKAVISLLDLKSYMNKEMIEAFVKKFSKKVNASEPLDISSIVTDKIEPDDKKSPLYRENEDRETIYGENAKGEIITSSYMHEKEVLEKIYKANMVSA